MKLRDYMREKDMTAAQLANLLGTSVAAVIRYRNGTRRPASDVMQRIYEITDGAVAPNDFYDLPSVGVGGRG